MDNKKQENSTVNAHKKSPASPGIFIAYYYRFMLISVSSISSETVIIFELPWNPRCVTIMSLNSLAFFTGILAYNSSLCYNITEKVFAINGRRLALCGGTVTLR